MMSAVVVQGIVREDGTLEIEGTVALPPGKVQITVEQVEESPLHPFIQRVRDRRRQYEEAMFEKWDKDPPVESEIDEESVSEEEDQTVLSDSPPSSNDLVVDIPKHPFIKRIRESRERYLQSGGKPRTAAEAQVDLAEVREEVEERIRELGRIQEAAHKALIEKWKKRGTA